MKKEAKVEFGIEIVKPWSKAMYAHNEQVADLVREIVLAKWNAAINEFQEDMGEEFMSDIEWVLPAGDTLREIQTAITCYGFGYGYNIAEVSRIVEQELEDAPYYRLRDIAEELELDLKRGFVGF